MAQYDLNDDSVVIVIGSGAGGGTLANELCQKGVPVVLLEAGKRVEFEDFVNDEWKSFLQLAWLDKRTTSGSWRVAKDFPNLPAWICKTVGGTTTHWAGASLRFQEHEFQDKSTYGEIAGANLLDWPLTHAEMDPYYAKAEDKMGVTRTNDIPGLPGNNNFKVMYNGATRIGYQTVHTGRMAINSRPRDDRNSLPPARLLLPGLQDGRQVVDALYRDPEGRGDRQARPAAAVDGPRRSSTTMPARSRASCTPTRTASSRCRRARIVSVACNSIESPRLLLNSASAKYPGRPRQLLGPGRPQLHAPHHGLGVRDLR